MVRAPSRQPERPGALGTESGGDKRRAILEAALDLMAERSFAATPVPAIAARAGVAAGTLYRYFPGKHALVNALYRDCKRSLRRALRQADARSGGDGERWTKLWRALLAFWRQQPSALRFLEMHRHQPYLDAESRALSRQVFEEGGALLDTGRAAEARRELPGPTLAALAFGAFVGLVKEAEAGHLELDGAALEAAGRAIGAMLRA